MFSVDVTMIFSMKLPTKKIPQGCLKPRLMPMLVSSKTIPTKMDFLTELVFQSTVSIR